MVIIEKCPDKREGRGSLERILRMAIKGVTPGKLDGQKKGFLRLRVILPCLVSA